MAGRADGWALVRGVGEVRYMNRESGFLGGACTEHGEDDWNCLEEKGERELCRKQVRGPFPIIHSPMSCSC